MEEVAIQEPHIKTIIQALKRTELIYLNIITIVSTYTRLSKSIALALSSRSDFIEEIIHRYFLSINYIE